MDKILDNKKLLVSNLGKNIRFLRKMKGISQQKLAEETGMKRNNIASYEAGIVEPRVGNLLKMARFFKVNPTEFVQSNLSKLPIASYQDLENSTKEDSQLLENEFRAAYAKFRNRTQEMQKILDGFREFYKYRMELQGEITTEMTLINNFNNILDLMERLLKGNWEFLEKLKDCEIRVPNEE